MNEHLRASDVAQMLCDDTPAPAPPAPSERPQPVMRPFRPFPVDALPARIAQFVRSVAGATSTDPSWGALAALVVIAGCVGNRAAVVLKRGWIEPAILWGALVGKSGSIKSVVLRLATRALVELFKIEREAYARKINEYHAELERYGVALSAWKRDQKAGPPTDPPVEPEKPREPRVLVSDITVEKLAALLGENPMGLLVVRDELAGLVNSFNRYAGGKGSDLQSWLSMNDAGALLVDRKSDGSTFVERASVSLLGTIQPFTLRHVFGTVEREAGLLARVLLAYPPDRPALWTDEELPDDVANAWRDLLAALLALNPARDEADHPRPHYIGISSDAKARFVKWHNQHAREVEQLCDDHLRAHWSKLKGCCARIALLFACAEAVSGNNVSAVSPDHMERAITITEWFKYESARVYAGLGGSAEDRARLQLIDWIRERGGKVTVREVSHGIWRLRNNADAAREALDELVQAGEGRWVMPSPGLKGGRPPEVFELTTPNRITITETTPDGIASTGFGDGEVGDGAIGMPAETTPLVPGSYEHSRSVPGWAVGEYVGPSDDLNDLTITETPAGATKSGGSGDGDVGDAPGGEGVGGEDSEAPDAPREPA